MVRGPGPAQLGAARAHRGAAEGAPEGMARMTKYAAKTTVSVQRSRDEIEAILTRYGADQFMYGWFEGGATIAFRAHGRMVRFHLPLPDAEDPEIKFTP